MAEISKLSVGQALDKLRGTEAPSSKIKQLDNKIDAIDEEMRRLKATSRRVERDQRAASTVSADHEEVAGRATRIGILWATIGIVLVIFILVSAWFL